jgi:integrase
MDRASAAPEGLVPKKSDRIKITKRVVDGLASGAADVFLWDAELRGFGIRIKPSGSAAYLIQYRNAEGRTRRLALAKIGTLTPEEARKLAREKLGSVAKGADPSDERHAAREAMTVADLCGDYLKACKRGEHLGRQGRPLKPATQEGDRLRIDVHVKPLIGARAAVGITQDDVRKLQADIAGGKTARPREKGRRGGVRTGGRGTASRVLGMLGAIFEYAKARKIVKGNPVRGVTRHPDQKRDRFLCADELRRLGAAMDKLSNEGENATGLAAIRLLAITGLRRSEALALRRTWVDGQNRCIRFPDTKTGPQLRPIGSEAVKLIECRATNKANWTFGADRGEGHFVGLPKVLARVAREAKIVGLSAHVLRHTFASVAAELNFSELTIAGLLGHAVPGVTARYSHLPDSALVAAADRVSMAIVAHLEGKDAVRAGESDDKIVPLRGQARR